LQAQSQANQSAPPAPRRWTFPLPQSLVTAGCVALAVVGGLVAALLVLFHTHSTPVLPHTGFPTSAAGTGQHCRPGRRGHHPQPHHYPDARRPSPPRQPPHSPRRTRQLTTPTQQSSLCPHPSPQPDGGQPSLTCEAPSLGAIAGDTGPSTQPPGVGWRRRTTRASCITALHHRLRPAHPDQIIHALVTREPITVATQRRDRQGNR
jgi:hypothetical protein